MINFFYSSVRQSSLITWEFWRIFICIGFYGFYFFDLAACESSLYLDDEKKYKNSLDRNFVDDFELCGDFQHF